MDFSLLFLLPWRSNRPTVVNSFSSFPLLFSLPTATSNPFSQKPQLFSTLLYSLVPIIGLAAVVLFSFWMWRHHKLAYPAALVPTHVSLTCASKKNENQIKQSLILLSSLPLAHNAHFQISPVHQTLCCAESLDAVKSLSFCLFSLGDQCISLHLSNLNKGAKYFFPGNTCYLETQKLPKKFCLMLMNQYPIICPPKTTLLWSLQYDTWKTLYLTNLQLHHWSSFSVSLSSLGPSLPCAAEGDSCGQTERTHCAESLHWDNCFFSLPSFKFV